MPQPFAITMRMKDVFFDRAAVKNRMTKANRSALIRVALEQLDLDKVPRGL